MTLKECAHFPA